MNREENNTSDFGEMERVVCVVVRTLCRREEHLIGWTGALERNGEGERGAGTHSPAHSRTYAVKRGGLFSYSQREELLLRAPARFV